MYDIISSICSGLLILCAANIYLSFDVILKHKYEDGDVWLKEKQRFAIGVLMMNIYMFIGALGWILWDGDLISKNDQYKISLLGRFFAVGGNFLFFLTLSLGLMHNKKLAIIIGSIMACATMYFYKVL